MSDTTEILIRQAERLVLMEANQATLAARLQRLEEAAEQARVDAEQASRREMATLRQRAEAVEAELAQRGH